MKRAVSPLSQHTLPKEGTNYLNYGGTAPRLNLHSLGRYTALYVFKHGGVNGLLAFMAGFNSKSN